jgi:riboflavin kinase/FMN adenylyltransferase
VWVTSSLTTAITPTAIALGNFDGVHLGHQAVISSVLAGGNCPGTIPNQHCAYPRLHDIWLEQALKGYSSRLASGFEVNGSHSASHPGHGRPPGMPVPTVMTFFPHPQEFFSGVSRPLLTPLEEKAMQMSALGVEQLVLLPFNQHLANLSPRQFVESLLIKQLQVKRISVGKDFCFGKGRKGTVDDLKQLAADYGVDVCVTPSACLGAERISSSRIRAALEVGDLPTVHALLGRPYRLIGRVVQGQQLGRQLGFPTANLRLPPEKFLPRYGVYSVLVQGAMADPYGLIPGVMNIGVRPTVDGLVMAVEVHLMEWSGAAWAGDLYGKTIQVLLQHFLRPEQKFLSLEQLKQQIQQDCSTALAVLKSQPIGNFNQVGAL